MLKQTKDPASQLPKLTDRELGNLMRSYNNKAGISSTDTFTNIIAWNITNVTTSDLDYEGIQRRKKQIYKKDIALVNRVEDWRKDIFSLKPIDYMFMNSLFLNDNALFKEVRQIFANYNREVRHSTAHEYSLVLQVRRLDTDVVHTEHLRPKVIDSMLKFMRLVMLTEDREAQLSILATAHKWLKDNLDKDKDYNPSFNYEQDLSNKINEVKPRPAPTSLLPSEKIKFDSRHYRWKARTEYSQMDPPQERIKNYKRRILNFEEGQDESAKPQPLTSKKVIKYIKPVPPIPPVPDQLLADEVYNDQNNRPGQVPAVDSNGQQAATNGIAPDAAGLPGEAVTEGVEDALGLGDGEGDQQGQEPEPEEPEDVVGKLDPRVKNYLYPNPIFNYKTQISLEQRRLLSEQRELAQHREEERKVQFVRNWARHKGRVHTQVSRRMTSTREVAKLRNYGDTSSTRLETEQASSKFINLDHDEKPFKEYYEFEDKIHLTSINEIKYSKGKYFQIQKQDTPVKAVGGLSIFDKGRSKTQYQKSPAKPFSSILNEYSRQRERENSIKEIEEIKQRLAKYKVPIEMKKIGQGLIHPADLAKAEIQRIGSVEPDLPSNPFFKVAKKKKKGKKK